MTPLPSWYQARWHSTLKAILRGELNNAVLRGRADDLAEAGAVVDAGDAQVGVVESVEKLCAELKRIAFVDGESLVEVEIDVYESWTAKDANAGIPEGLVGDEAVLGWIHLQRLEGAGVEVTVHRALIAGQRSTPQPVGTALALASPVQLDGVVDRGGETRLSGDDRR